jgi:acetylornithine deacetylase/succinyl-diaminopimelate desuccinylase-like protein
MTVLKVKNLNKFEASMTSLLQFKDWFSKKQEQIKQDYFSFLRFQSISADPDYKKEVLSCAKWLESYVKKHTDMQVELIETQGYPLLYAEDLSAGKAAPTLLAYGHYDVQPVDPVELWKSDPFEPEERDGKIFARGAVDDKGQIFYAITAVRAWKELGFKLPINLKFCIEGEEESSSTGLSKSLTSLKDKMQTDYLLVVDFGQFDEETPAVSLGARGILAMEVVLKGSDSDLHSGEHGGIAYNPNKALVQLLAKLWDENGRVQVDGFYDGIEILSEEQKAQFAFRYDKERYSKEFGVHAFGGEKHLSLAENNTFLPTLEINGISGGYAGKGFKTVIPKEAVAKISARLAPHQDPEKIARSIERFLKQNVVPGIQIDVHYLGGEPAFRGNLNSPLTRAIAKASEEVTGKVCRNVLSGASIPIMAKMVEQLQCDIAGMGYCLPSDDIHAPNEHFSWDRFEKGFLTVARILESI